MNIEHQYNIGLDLCVFSGDEYRYGFNGYEKDDEVKGNGNYISFENFGYDPRIARRQNIDPLWKIFPYQSPYAYALNNPIRFIDEDGEGPGDGTMRLYVTKTTIKTSKGPRTVYLKKRYYENVTPAQVKKYKDAAVTSSGWYFATKEEYENFQRDPSQFTSKVYGADTPSKDREFGDTQGSPFGQPIDVKGEKEGELHVETNGVNSEGDQVSQTFELSIVSKNGDVISSEIKTTDGEGNISFDYELGEGESLLLEKNGESTSNIVKIKTKEKKGDKSLSNMEDYEQEVITDKDKKEIKNAL